MSKEKKAKPGKIALGESGYPVMSEMFVPKAIFFTHGAGVHKDRLSSFELALRDAGIEKANLVTVSSIFPPHCREISRKEGQKYIMPGQIVHCVMARQDTNEPNRLIAASIGLARPADPEQYGYLSEHHSYGETAKRAGEYAEDLAATMLATTLGIDMDTEKAWSERHQAFKLEKSFLKTRNVVQSAEGHAKGQWCTVVALGVFIF
jgi:arginine decarboxylase